MSEQLIQGTTIKDLPMATSLSDDDDFIIEDTTPETKRIKWNTVLDAIKNEVWKTIYPIGAIYMSVNSANPGTLFGGTWVAWGAGKVPVGVNSSETEFSTVEKTGGAKTHTLTTDQMPSHTHTGPSHTHSMSHTHGAGSLSAASNGAHTHKLNRTGYDVAAGGGSKALTTPQDTSRNDLTASSGAHTHTVSGTTGTSSITSTGSSGTGNTGGAGSGEAHNNLQPYITCYMWKRTA